MLSIKCILCFYCFEKNSYFVAHTNLKYMAVFLPQPPRITGVSNHSCHKIFILNIKTNRLKVKDDVIVLIVNLIQSRITKKRVSMRDCLDKVGLWAYLWGTS